MPAVKSVFATTKTAKPNTLAKRGKFRFAAACAALMSDEECAWWLREVMAGRDPDARRDADGNPIAPAGGFVAVPEWKDRLKAAQIFFERRNGQAPASLLVEEHLHVSGAVQHAVSSVQIRQMDPERKAALRQLLKEAVRGELPAEARDANPPPDES